MLNTPFSPWPSFTEEEAESVRQVLLSNKVNYWTGTQCREFESEFAGYCGVQYAIALANGTVALDLALVGLGIGHGDDVIVTSRTFMASVSSIVLAGARPVFADVDIETQNITVDTIAAVLTPSTKAIMCVHLAGWPCDMEAIIAFADAHGLVVIEDCAQAHGAQWKGRSVGSTCHVGVWSFCQDKIMTTCGEGGMVTTNDSDLWSKMWSYKDHGKSWDAVYNRQHAPGFRWVHESFGTNWRMTEMQAAVGRIQLRRLPEWGSARRHNATQIWQEARRLDCLRAPILSSEQGVHAAYKCYLFVEPNRLKTGWSRDRFIHEINELGVPCSVGSCSEVYLEKAFVGTPYEMGHRLPNAKLLGETSVMFMVHPTLISQEIEMTLDALRTVVNWASR